MEINQQGVAPKNWLVESILATLFCCLPLGVIGIIYAASVEGKFLSGDIQGAAKASQTAKTMVLISLALGLLVAFLYFIIFGVALLGSLDSDY